MFADGEEIAAYLRARPFVLAPMVDQSDLPFRMLVRAHNVGLCFSPMVNAKLAAANATYRAAVFATAPGDRPLAVQLAGSDPQTVLAAARHFEHCADLIDLNFGCPQRIAKRGDYGAFLLEREDAVEALVRHLAAHLRLPLACKIRVFEDAERTLRLARRLEAAGCALLTVHGRTRAQNKLRVGSADWALIARICRAVRIPVLLNGGVETLADARRALAETGCAGVMSAEAILEYPALFAGPGADPDRLAAEYLAAVRAHADQDAFVKPHLFKLLFAALQQHVDLRERLSAARSVEECAAVAAEVAERGRTQPVTAPGWYRRHRRGEPVECAESAKRAEPVESAELLDLVQSAELAKRAELVEPAEPAELAKRAEP